jgi:microcompartment protein CcmL/EutN
VEIRLARGMGGKSYILLTGDVAAVSAAIEHAAATIGESGMVLDSAVIPNPDKSLWDSIL